MRHRPSGGGREGTGCAALRCAAPARRRGPGRRQRWAELPPPPLHPLLGERAGHRPGEGMDGFPGFPSYAGPTWGSLCVHLCSPSSHPPIQGRGQFGLRSPKPARGCFRLLGWEFPAVAMAPGTCCGGRPPAAPHGVLRIPSCTTLLAAPSSPAFASLPIGPPRLTQKCRFKTELGLKTTHGVAYNTTFRFRFQILRLHLYFHLRWRPQKVFMCIELLHFLFTRLCFLCSWCLPCLGIFLLVCLILGLLSSCIPRQLSPDFI